MELVTNVDVSVLASKAGSRSCVTDQVICSIKIGA